MGNFTNMYRLPSLRVALYVIIFIASATTLLFYLELNRGQSSLPFSQFFELYTKESRNQTEHIPIFRLLSHNVSLLTFSDIESYRFEKYAKILTKNEEMEVIAITHPSKRNVNGKCFNAKIDYIHWTFRAYNISMKRHSITKFRKCDFVLDPIAFLAKGSVLDKLYQQKIVKFSTQIPLLQFQLLLLREKIKIFLANEEISVPKYHLIPTESQVLNIFEESNIKRVIYPNGTAELWGCMKTNNSCCKVTNPLYPKGCRHVNHKEEWIKTPPCCLKRQIQLTQMFSDFAKEFDIDYVIGYGTLLGYHRCKGIIPYDYDVDVMVPHKEFVKIKEILPKLKSKPYVIEMKNGNVYFMFKNNTYMRYLIDLFIWSPNGNHIGMIKPQCMRQSDYFPSTKGKFNGIDVKVPNDPIKRIECAFGKDAFEFELIKDEDWKTRNYLKYYKRKIVNLHNSCGYGDTTVDDIGN